MEENGIQFLLLNKDEKAQVIFEMVDDLMKETHLPIEICIAMVADYKKYSILQIESYLKRANPKFFYYAVFYDDNNELIYKHQAEAQTIRILKKNLMELILQHPFEIQDICKFIKKILTDYYESIDWNSICHNVNILNEEQ